MTHSAHQADAAGSEAAQAEGLEPSGAAQSRYQIVERAGDAFLQCSNAANLRLYLIPGVVVSEAGRKSYPRQSIFLDGVFDGAPFLDNQARQYSLDHHAGCVRAFTLATCEQAAVLLLHGLPMTEGTWSVYINQADLDALLAAWLLLNHTEMLRDEHLLLQAVMPLVRVQANIDSHGLEKSALAALPVETYAAHKQVLDDLMEMEASHGDPQSAPPAQPLVHARVVFDRLDRLFLTEGYLVELMEVEQLGSVAINASQVAILCRSSRGIYHAEARLKDAYGKQLGVIVLTKGGGHFTLRLVDPFLAEDLSAVYRRLNRLDSSADRKSNNLWGGAAEIGGSPRASGSALPDDEILAVVGDVFQHVPWRHRVWRWFLPRRVRARAAPATAERSHGDQPQGERRPQSRGLSRVLVGLLVVLALAVLGLLIWGAITFGKDLLPLFQAGRPT